MPKAGPTFESMLAETETASNGREPEPGACRVDREHGGAEDEDPDVEQDERRDRAERPLLDDAPVQAHRQDDLRVQRLVDLAPQDLPEQQVAHDLDGARRRPGRAADEHQPDDRHQRERRPGVVVRDREARRRHRRDRREHAGAHRVPAREDVLRPDLGHDDDRADHEQGEVEPQLLVSHGGARLPADDRAVHQREVDPAEHHEDEHNPLGRRRERLDRVHLRREAGCRDRREGVRERVERRHLLVDARRPEREEDPEERRR